MIRRFVNIVACNGMGKHWVHRLDVAKHLFHPSRADAQLMPLLGDEPPPAPMMMAESVVKEVLPPRLPMNIGSTRTSLTRNNDLAFAGLLSPRSSEDKILGVNQCGDALLYDAGRNSVRAMASLPDDHVGGRVVAVAVPQRRDDAHARQEEEEQEDDDDDLYLMHKHPRRPRDEPSCSCFSVLRRQSSEDRWQWELLPPPPFLDADWYKGIAFPRSHTVVDGGRTICMSFQSSAGLRIGTYCFDTAAREWRRAGYCWELPFEGRAEYIPGLDLWLGLRLTEDDDTDDLCPPPQYLCATTDLSAAMAREQDQAPPELQYVWQDLVMPEDWMPSGSSLLNLGAGRFCVAKRFHVWPPGFKHDVAVVTGVEIGKQQQGQVQAWKHRAILYPTSSIEWIL